MAMSSSVRPVFSVTPPFDVAISSSTVSKWCAVIVGHGPFVWITSRMRACWSSL